MCETSATQNEGGKVRLRPKNTVRLSVAAASRAEGVGQDIVTVLRYKSSKSLEHILRNNVTQSDYGQMAIETQGKRHKDVGGLTFLVVELKRRMKRSTQQ
jgi:hypothetical protein